MNAPTKHGRGWYRMPRPDKPHILKRGRWLVRDTPPDGPRTAPMPLINAAVLFARVLNNRGGMP